MEVMEVFLNGALRRSCITGSANKALGPFSNPVCYAMNHDQRCNAASQQKGRCNKGRAQATAREEPAMTAEGNDDVPLRLGCPPTRQGRAQDLSP